MRNDWILDVLADLGEFARRNSLAGLADELNRVRNVARIELSGNPGLVSSEGRRHAETAGTGHRDHTERQEA